MKQARKDKLNKKMALFLAKILSYDKVIRLKDWQGCPIFEPLFFDGSTSAGVPLMIIVRNGVTSSLSIEETVEYMQASYPAIPC